MTIAQQLDRRYGRTRSPRRRRVLLALATVALLAAAIYAWVAAAALTDSVDVDTTAFEVMDEHAVTLKFQITAPPNTAVACALEAQDVEHGIVGWKIVEYAGASSTAQAREESIPTTAEATTGFVNACWVP